MNTETQTHQCPQCPKSFDKAQGLRLHILRKHRDKTAKITRRHSSGATIEELRATNARLTNALLNLLGQ